MVAKAGSYAGAGAGPGRERWRRSDEATCERPEVALRLLVVDDDAVNRQIIALLLQRMGYRADFAADGTAALQAIARRNYDVVFMDIHLPGDDGLETTRKLRELDSKRCAPFVIAMTASASAVEGAGERFLAAGMNAWIGKPLRPPALASLLAQVGHVLTSPRTVFDRVAITPTLWQHAIEPAVEPALFAARLGAGQEALHFRLVGLFTIESAGTLAQLESAISAGLADDVRRLAHQLKGSSANVAAVALASVACELEERSGRGELAQAGDYLMRLKAELLRVESWLRSSRL